MSDYVTMATIVHINLINKYIKILLGVKYTVLTCYVFWAGGQLEFCINKIRVNKIRDNKIRVNKKM